MQLKPIYKTLSLFFVFLILILGTVTLANRAYQDDKNRIKFDLIDQYGNEISELHLAGKFALVFFGFTSCQDVCPTQMSKISTAMSVLDGMGYGKLVTPVFITIDPARDSRDKIAEYLKFFDSRFVGLTGERDQIQITTQAFKTYFDTEPKDQSTDYQLTHSSIIYILDPFNRMVDWVPDNADPQFIADKVKMLVKQS